MDFMCPLLLFHFACDDSWCSQNLVKVVVDLVTCGVYGGVIVNTKKERKKEKEKKERALSTQFLHQNSPMLS